MQLVKHLVHRLFLCKFKFGMIDINKYLICRSIVITSIIPLIQLIVGAMYKDQCRIQPLIPTYMIVAGVCGLIVVGILIFLSL